MYTRIYINLPQVNKKTIYNYFEKNNKCVYYILKLVIMVKLLISVLFMQKVVKVLFPSRAFF